jgi:phage regulator Rha-like protein
MSRHNGRMDPEERFERIEATLAEIANIQRQQARVLHAHAQILAEHDTRMAEHDERMDRVGRHLEVLIAVTDGLIREGGKKRRGRSSS